MNASRNIPAAFEAPCEQGVDLLIISGEHSGDEHAAKMLEQMRCAKPDLKVACLGGSKLAGAGAQLLYDLTAVSVVGFVEVLRHYTLFKGLFDCTLAWIEEYQPKHICFVDYPGFNLRLAKELHKRGLCRKAGGDIGLHYYIGPQVWAWKAKRRFMMADTIDRLSVIFPFEIDCFRDTELAVEYVVHPFAREAHELPFYHDREGPVLLLPGSRSEACQRIFPLLLSGFSKAREAKPQLRARVIYPSERIREILESILKASPELSNSVELVAKSEERLGVRAALMSSGTMSLTVAMSGIPGAIVYRMNAWSYRLSRFLLKVPYIGISNLLLKRPLHPEFIQGAANAKNLSRALLNACLDESANAAAKGSDDLKAILHPKGAPQAEDWLLRGLA